MSAASLTGARLKPVHPMGILLAGILLWVGICSDYQWASTAANLLYPPAVGLAGWLSLRRCRSLPSAMRRRCRLCHLPAILGGAPYLLLWLLALFPLFWLGILFAIDEQANVSVIQHEASPDGRKVAEVHFFPVGAYSGGNGRIRVYLKYEGIPLIRREIYARRVSHANEETNDYLEWVDDGRIYITEAGATIEPGIIHWHIPDFVVFIARLVYLLIRG